jgi:hypothetical protein
MMTGQLPAWFGSKGAIPTSSSTMHGRLEAVPHRERTKELMRPFVRHFALGVFAMLLEACDSLAYVISRVGQASFSGRIWLCVVVNDASLESRSLKMRTLGRRRSELEALQ